MANSADPDQFRSQLIWIYTVCKGRAYPGSAGQGLSFFFEKNINMWCLKTHAHTHNTHTHACTHACTHTHTHTYTQVIVFWMFSKTYQNWGPLLKERYSVHKEHILNFKNTLQWGKQFHVNIFSLGGDTHSISLLLSSLSLYFSVQCSVCIIHPSQQYSIPQCCIPQQVPCVINNIYSL